MCARVQDGAPVLLLTMLALFSSACTTSLDRASPLVTVKSRSAFALRAVDVQVDPIFAKSCMTAAASKYFLPESVISATDSYSISGGLIQVSLKVDVRSAVCTVGDNGVVRSIVDISPKDSDQLAAEEVMDEHIAAIGQKFKKQK